MSAGPQTREQWHEDLTTGFLRQTFRERRASIQKYWEDVGTRSAIAWCTESGALVDGDKYEIDTIFRYEFDEDGRLEKLFEHTDSHCQLGIRHRFAARIEKQKETQKKNQRQHDRFILITYPRTASNMLVRILALGDQPNVAYRESGGYFFMPLIVLMRELKVQGKHIEQWTKDEKDQVMHSCQRCFNELQAHLDSAEVEGKMVFIKEHSYFITEPTAHTEFLYGQNSVKESSWTVQIPSSYGPQATRTGLNKTVLPDEFLHIWRPIFLIRHPALAFPSFYRTILDLDGEDAVNSEEERIVSGMTLHWTRTLYDWYVQHLSSSGPESDGNVTWPLVIDADDIMTEPEVVIKLCEIVGLDSTKLRFTWSPATQGELDQISNHTTRRMLSTLLASAGVMKWKTAAHLEIETEAWTWREEFGEVGGAKIEKLVRAAMPDYEFLKAKRLRPGHS